MLTLTGARKAFGADGLFHGLSLTLASGSIFVCWALWRWKVIASSVLVGLEALDGSTLTRRSAAGLGLVFQIFALLPFDALGNVTLALRAARVWARRKRRSERGRPCQVGLEAFAHKARRPFRGAAAAGRHCSRPGLRPAVLLFDEPTSALDPERTARLGLCRG